MNIQNDTAEQRPFIIGIAGGSGSGKSTVTQQIVAAAGADGVSVIVQDNYYRDQSELTFEQRCKANYDHPHAFDWPLLLQQVADLQLGLPIDMPQYDFSQHNRSPQSHAVASSPIIVFEGIFALYDSRLRDMMALKIFVDTDADVRLIRRIVRDIQERGRTLENILTQYKATVRPMHNQFVEPTKRFADLILPHGSNQAAIDMITTKISTLLQRV